MKKFIKSKELLNTLLFYFIMTTVFALILILNTYTPLVNDDLNYSYSVKTGEKIDSIMSVPSSMAAHYYSTNARLYTHSLAQIFLFLGKNTFNIINSIAFVLLGLLIYYHIVGSLKNKKPEILSIIYSSLFLFAPAFGQSFLWLTGASNYLYGILTILICLVPFRKYISPKNTMHTDILTNCLMTFVMFFAGLICGNSNENNSVAFICIILSYIIYILYNNKKIVPWMISTLIGAILGLLSILFSPGQSARLAGAGGFDIQETLINFIKHTISLFTNFSTLFIIAIFIIVTLNFKNSLIKCLKQITIKFVLNLINKYFIIFTYFIALLASVYSMIVAPYFPLRTWSGPLVFMIILVGSLYTYLEEKEQPITRNYAISLAIILTFISACTYCGDAFFAIRNDKININKRIELINTAKLNNKNEVEIPSIHGNSRYSVFYGNPENGDFLSYDSSEWPNNIIAKYYEIPEIIRNDKTN